METKPPFIYDSLDKTNASQRSGEKVKYRSDWRVVAVICFTIIVFAVLFILLHQWAFYLIIYEYGGLQTVGYILLAVIYIAMSALALFTVGIAAFWGINKARTAGLVNILDHQLTLDALNRLNYADRMFDVAMKRADRSWFQGVQTLTLDQSKSITGNANLEDAIDEITEKGNVPLFDELQTRGLINRSGNSLLIGFEDE